MAGQVGQCPTGRWVLAAPGQLLVATGALPAPAPSEAVVGTLLAGICGSDLHAPTIYCGQCKQCRRGAINFCENPGFFGCVHPQGGMADRCTLVGQSLALALKGGTVVVIGVPEAPVTIELLLLQDRQVCIQGSATYLPGDYATSMRLLKEGLVRAEDIATRTLPLDDVEEAFAAAASGEDVKMLVRP